MPRSQYPTDFGGRMLFGMDCCGAWLEKYFAWRRGGEAVDTHCTRYRIDGRKLGEEIGRLNWKNEVGRGRGKKGVNRGRIIRNRKGRRSEFQLHI